VDLFLKVIIPMKELDKHHQYVLHHINKYSTILKFVAKVWKLALLLLVYFYCELRIVLWRIIIWVLMFCPEVNLYYIRGMKQNCSRGELSYDFSKIKGTTPL
jgi:hypothetical protein